jgi:ketose-bisphosphate aldolase
VAEGSDWKAIEEKYNISKKVVISILQPLQVASKFHQLIQTKGENMSIVNAKEIMVEAVKGKYAVGAFNVTDLLQFEAVIDAAVEKKAPVIVQTSVKPSQFLGTSMMVAIYRNLASSASVPVCLHLDHCTDIDYCKKCADAGYTNIMIDASKKAYDENIRQTKEVVDYCHKVGNISVEGELGTVSGVEDQVKVAEDEAQLANPKQSVEFVERTGLDIFAPAIGTAHGVYKTKNPKIDFDRLATINKMINGNGIKTPLVVHGGTGLPEEYIKKLLAAGGAKFNVSTELKHTLIDAKFEYISAHRDEYDPGKIDIAVRDATRKAVIHWMEMLECVGKA